MVSKEIREKEPPALFPGLGNGATGLGLGEFVKGSLITPVAGHQP